MACWNILWIISGRCLASRASMCRMDSSGMSRLSSMLATMVGLSLGMGVDSSNGAEHSLTRLPGTWQEAKCWQEKTNQTLEVGRAKGWSGIRASQQDTTGYRGAKEWMNVFPVEG